MYRICKRLVILRRLPDCLPGVVTTVAPTAETNTTKSTALPPPARSSEDFGICPFSSSVQLFGIVPNTRISSTFAPPGISIVTVIIVLTAIRRKRALTGTWGNQECSDQNVQTFEAQRYRFDKHNHNSDNPCSRLPC